VAVSPVLTAVLAVGAVVVIALLARSSSRSEDANGPAGTIPVGDGAADGDEGAEPGMDEDDDDDWESVDVVAVTSEGYALVPDKHTVRLIPPHEDGEAWKAGEKGRNRRGEAGLADSWHNADFTGARVVRGAADEGPWRFEALGRDGEYFALVFETREGADAAVKLFESRGVVKTGEDEDGNPAPPSAEQFEEARRIYLETEAALEMPDDPDHQ
jgi:hypothetical protein